MVTGVTIIAVVIATSGIVSMFDSSAGHAVMADTYCAPAITGQSRKLSARPDERPGENEAGFLQFGEREDSGDEHCSRAYLFGTDAAGTDLFREMTTSTFQYVVPVAVVVVIAIVLGGTFGVLSGYYGQTLSARISVPMSGSASVFPPLILAWLVARILDPPLVTIAVAIGITESARLGFSISNKITTLAQEEFIDAAKEMGLSDWRIITRHILWTNCRELLLIHSLFAVSTFIMIELYLGYLGAGSFEVWGEVINRTWPRHTDFPVLVLLPSAFASMVLIGLAMVANAMVRQLDERSHTW
jgi:ABC-type dipeptide/oligopeptide/nickel transport system permease subunit